MDTQKKELWVKQLTQEGAVTYCVYGSANLLDPEIGAELGKIEVQGIIDSGVDVNITSDKD